MSIDFLALERPWLMGIVNVTPDSFSNHGEHRDPELAIAHGLRLAAEGADLIDVGGESTRPGAARLDAPSQCARILDVIRALRARLPRNVGVSVDTTLADVAAAALDAGAEFINDIAAGRESDTLRLAAERRVPIALMHMQGTPATMQDAPEYGDVLAEVKAFLCERAAAAVAAGIPRGRILIDPGIGFGKSKRHNLELVAGLRELAATGYPVMLGTSRKRFMGAICRETEFRELIGATCATTALGVLAGVRLFRVHDVRPNRQALEVTLAVAAARPRP
jgi:dihydropteroate synthase